MTPMERAARALRLAEGKDYPDKVRAVLQAIREPSEGMVAAGARCRTDPDRFAGPDADDSLRPEWQAMIDAALEEG